MGTPGSSPGYPRTPSRQPCRRVFRGSSRRIPTASGRLTGSAVDAPRLNLRRCARSMGPAIRRLCPGNRGVSPRFPRLRHAPRREVAFLPRLIAGHAVKNRLPSAVAVVRGPTRRDPVPRRNALRRPQRPTDPPPVAAREARRAERDHAVPVRQANARVEQVRAAHPAQAVAAVRHEGRVIPPRSEGIASPSERVRLIQIYASSLATPLNPSVCFRQNLWRRPMKSGRLSKGPGLWPDIMGFTAIGFVCLSRPIRIKNHIRSCKFSSVCHGLYPSTVIIAHPDPNVYFIPNTLRIPHKQAIVFYEIFLSLSRAHLGKGLRLTPRCRAAASGENRTGAPLFQRALSVPAPVPSRPAEPLPRLWRWSTPRSSP